ncbi:hypothetical protein OIO90_005168 [Microbotryomycetes sp. JL221]|nr:hypothetical protein OIO90_005168 [Microbotryomycetes sp. JL221]
MSVAVVQGAGGSIGTHFVRHLLKQTRLEIVATTRNPQQFIRHLDDVERQVDKQRLTVLELDVKNEHTIERAAKQVQDKFGRASLKLLLNVSGVLHADKSVQQVKQEELLDHFQLNTFGHLLMYKHFVPLLPKTADIKKRKDEPDLTNGNLPRDLSVLASLTARVGSIGDNHKGGWIGYRASKAATNQIIMTLQRELDLKSTPSIAIALHPGTVVGTNLSKRFTKEEDAGKKQGVFQAQESTQKLLDVIKSLTQEDGGKFLDWAGKDIQW